MPRKARFAPPGYWLHLTQRGNNQQRIFASHADRQYFLQLLETHSEQRAVRIAAYTLMSNHFHLVAVGDQPDAISLFMMDVNGRYATYRHALERGKVQRACLAPIASAMMAVTRLLILTPSFSA